MGFRRGVLMAKIAKIEQEHYQGWVYGIDVENDESFVANGLVVHNCEKGVNQGALFDILKSIPANLNPSLEVLLNSFADDPLVMPGFSVTIEKSDNPKVVIRADRANSITDWLILELSKRLPENTPIVVYDDSLVVTDHIPIYKMQLTPLWKGVDPDELAMGMEVELEHTDITGGDLETTKKIAEAHLREIPDYYTRLKEMESEGKKTQNLEGENNMPEDTALTVFVKWLEKAEEGSSDPIYDYEGREKKHRQLLDEQGFPEDYDNADQVRDYVPEEKAEPYIVNEGGSDEELDPEDKEDARGEKTELRRFDS